jgi:hypothetical protein
MTAAMFKELLLVSGVSEPRNMDLRYWEVFTAKEIR